MKYRKKTTEIEAFQWMGSTKGPEWPKWLCDAHESGKVYCFRLEGDRHLHLVIETPHGLRVADPWDYIIQRAAGEIDYCKPDVFERIYEKVEENDGSINHI